MPVHPTQSYSRFKAQSETLLDFAVLVSYAVPALRDELAKVKTSKQASMLPPDFFSKSNRSTPEDLLKTEAGYEHRLAAYVLLAHFSFFESFVVDVLSEMVDFHGGKDEFINRNEVRSRQFVAPHSPNIAKLKRKLQDYEKRGKHERYRKYARQLAREGFRFPGELLAAYGVRNLVLKLKRLKAFEIPSFLVDALRVDLSAADIERFNQIREIRNQIAHGQTPKLSMKESIEMNKDLRDLAIKISAHLTENFFVIEKYAP